VIVRSLKDWRKVAKGVINPAALAGGRLSDIVVIAGGYGNGYRNDRPWIIYTMNPESGYDVGSQKEFPEGSFAALSVNKMICWVPVPPEEAQRPCSEKVYRSQGRAPGTTHPCARPALDGDTLCGLHRGGRNRAAAAEAERAQANDRSLSNRQIAEDAVAELAALDIKGKANFEIHGSGSYDGRVKVHAEDLLALLREVREFREMKDLL
jgi:hypothetical protein